MRRPIGPKRPKAYGGCRCKCHKTGAKHVVSCCSPNRPEPIVITPDMCGHCTCLKDGHLPEGACFKHLECEKYKPIGKTMADIINNG